MIFDVKMELTPKLRYVADGNLNNPPSSTTYATVFSRESVRIEFLIDALNNLDILAWYIQNVYLNTKTKEKILFYAGDEWKSDQGKVVVIVRALYGLKQQFLKNRFCHHRNNPTNLIKQLQPNLIKIKQLHNQQTPKLHSSPHSLSTL